MLETIPLALLLTWVVGCALLGHAPLIHRFVPIYAHWVVMGLYSSDNLRRSTRSGENYKSSDSALVVGGRRLAVEANHIRTTESAEKL